MVKFLISEFHKNSSQISLDFRLQIILGNSTLGGYICGGMKSGKSSFDVSSWSGCALVWDSWRGTQRLEQNGGANFFNDLLYEVCSKLHSLRNRAQVKQLLSYIVEEASKDAEEKQIFKFPYIACEIFMCEIDAILNSLVEDEMMNMLFSFLKPDHSHNTLLAGYFSKVVICLTLRKTTALITYVQNHQEILRQLVDLIGITSIMEVLRHLIGASEDIYSNYNEMQWLKDTNVLEMIIDKFRTSDSPEVHANAADVLCAVIRYAPPGLSSEICCSSSMGRLFHHALEGSRPKSVLVHALSVCISLLDPKRLVSASYNLFRSQLAHGSLVAANPATVVEMLESLADLLKLLDVSSAAIFFPTTYGYLKPPFGKHRLKIVEFISVLLTIGSEAAEKELVRQGAIKQILNLFFEYPYNSFLHHAVENMIGLCLECKNTLLIKHLLMDCDIVGKILGAEKQPLLIADCSKPTIATRGRSPPRIGNFGHMTRIANKLIQLSNSNDLIKTHLQENKEWVVWHASVLFKRNAVENVSQWACGRPNALQDKFRDSDNDFRDTDYEVVALASNSGQACSNEGSEEAHVSLEQDDEAHVSIEQDDEAHVFLEQDDEAHVSLEHDDEAHISLEQDDEVHVSLEQDDEAHVSIEQDDEVASFDKESAEASSSSGGFPENQDNILLFTSSSLEGRIGKDRTALSSDQNQEVTDSNGNANLVNSRTSEEHPQSSILESGDNRPTDSENSSEVLSGPDTISSSKVNEDRLVMNETIGGEMDVHILSTSEIGIPGEASLAANPSTDEDTDNVVTEVSQAQKYEKCFVGNEGG